MIELISGHERAEQSVIPLYFSHINPSVTLSHPLLLLQDWSVTRSIHGCSARVWFCPRKVMKCPKVKCAFKSHAVEETCWRNNQAS